MKTKLTMMVAMAAACAATELTAMPTAAETRRAEPVVRKLLAPERAALRSGRKTRSEVAAAARELADKAATDAEKLLLMKGAFVLYVRDGNLEKAVETMNALEAAIADMPPQSVTNMIEMALLGVTKKGEGARLYKLLDEKRGGGVLESGTDSGTAAQPGTNQQVFSRMFPGWQASVKPTIESRHRGQNNVAFVHPPSQETPAVVSSTLTLSKKNPCLFLKVSSLYEGSDFLLSVLVDGKEVLPKRLICTPDNEPWQDITVPLSAWRGSKVKIDVVLTANNWWCEHSFFKRLEVAEGTGQEKCGFAGAVDGEETVDGYTWSYRVRNGEATILSEKNGENLRAVSPMPTGAVSIPATLGGVKVTGIGRNAFLRCRLTTVTIPSSVKFIGSDAFKECYGLQSVTLPDGVKRIGVGAFYRCGGLASVIIPQGVEVIGGGAFSYCANLTTVTIPSTVTNIGTYAISDCSRLKSVTILGDVRQIEKGAIWKCPELTTVTIHGERPEAPNDIFRNCGKLKSIHVPAKAKSWAGMKEWLGIPLVFDGEDVGRRVQAERGDAQGGSLARLRQRRMMRRAAEDAAEQQQATVDGYTWSYRVKNGEATIVAKRDGKSSCAVSPTPTGDVKIPATLGGVKVTRIGWEAFRNCKEVTSVTIPEGVTHIDVHALGYCGRLKSVTLPSSLKDIGYAAFGGCVALESVTIPNGVRSIAADAFNGCRKVKSLVIPESVTHIGDRAFCGCRELESVAIPSGVANIGKGVFSGCNALKLINVDSGNQAVALIDGVLYTKDRSELVMWPNPRNAVVIPDGVTKIRGWAFAGGSGMTSVSIPESVTSIGEIAFIGCDGLKSITIPSSVKNIGEHAFERCVELTEVTMLGERPDAPETLFPGCGKLKAIHVPANAKSWAGMKDWFGIPLVFDAK